MNVNEELDKGIGYFIERPGKMVSLYKYLYGETISLCSSCPGFASDVEKRFKYLIDKKNNGGFQKIRMKQGRVINTRMWDIEGIPKGYYTCKNITDELAEKFINLGYQDHFIL